MIFAFFFSSRRRHTRSLRDWSSDVCSSDLECSMVSTATVSPESTLSLGGSLGSSQPHWVVSRVAGRQIGRASCRERVKIAFAADSGKTNTHYSANEQSSALKMINRSHEHLM